MDWSARTRLNSPLKPQTPFRKPAFCEDQSMRAILILVAASGLNLTFAFTAAALAEEPACVKESAGFANCVDSFLIKHAKESQSQQSIQDEVFKGCLNETKEYEVCGSINKTDYALNF